MKFEMWSFLHILYMASPFIIFPLIFLLIKNKSDKTKNIVGYILGGISILILVVRNVDIYLRSGFDVEIIPLQVCHIGSLVAGFALIFKRKWLLLTAFCFNMIPAFLAMVFADSLANYDSILKIRPQTYIWGHLFIIICALYGILVYKIKFKFKDLIYSIIFVFIMACLALLCNSLFRHLLNLEPNYFYLYSYEGTPLKFLYNVVEPSTYGWFVINWFYTIVLLVFFVCLFVIMYYLAKLITTKLNKKY